MRLIILAAGQDSLLDGMIKCLIRHPTEGGTVLDHLDTAAAGMDITVVVGYRAVEIIERYPRFNYVVNRDWAVTNNAYSLSLALDNSPCIITPGDIFVNRDTIARLMSFSENCALSSNRENRGPTAINAELDNNIIREIYTGPLHAAEDCELLGLYKITSPDLLETWQKNGFAHSNLYCGQTLPTGKQYSTIMACSTTSACEYYEINTVDDYLRLTRSCMEQERV